MKVRIFRDKREVNLSPLGAPLEVTQRDALLAAEAVVVGGAAGRVKTHVALRVANLRRGALI